MVERTKITEKHWKGAGGVPFSQETDEPDKTIDITGPGGIPNRIHGMQDPVIADRVRRSRRQSKEE